MQTTYSGVAEIAETFYNAENLAHVRRVASIAASLVPEGSSVEMEEAVYHVAMLHDVLNTDFPFFELHSYLTPDEMVSLSHTFRGNYMSFPQYIQHILDSGDKVAIIVKRAELIDYLTTSPGTLPENLYSLYQRGLAMLDDGSLTK